MATKNGFSVAPFYGNQTNLIATERRHIICFWKAFNPHHQMATEFFWSPQGLAIENI
jgi:hypothetical protein